ncbi:helix-turn-helix transcriptional regulator [Deinococcus sp. YIM 134068]|uniref:helix-turn-helix domain-containing protein n=1 Tax=Deinococcus lichenicola TaxID=3118910 RepID=UPI002F931624
MYLTIITSGERNWSALVPELTCLGTAPTRDDLIRLTREAIALALEDQPSAVPRLRNVNDLDADLRSDLDGSEEIVFLTPAEMNPVSLEIEHALKTAGVTQAELARRLGTSRSAVNRLVNPFYWGHSLDMLRRVAAALEAELEVKLTTKAS